MYTLINPSFTALVKTFCQDEKLELQTVWPEEREEPCGMCMAQCPPPHSHLSSMDLFVLPMGPKPVCLNFLPQNKPGDTHCASQCCQPVAV